MSDGVAAPARRPRSMLRSAVQISGFAIGLALLWYCASKALAAENREQLRKLSEASAGQIAALLALSLISLAINGSVFWLAARPVKRLPYRDTQAVNAIATLLALLPFKLSMIFRVVVHRARNGMPLLMGGAWMAAAAAIILAGVLPPAGASMWRHRAGGAGLDMWWWAAAIGGVVVLGSAMIGLGRLFLTPRGWGWIEGIARKFPGKKLHDVLLPRAHESLRMVSDPLAVCGGIALRAVDIAVQTARFLIAAQIIGVALPLDQAIIIASAYFLIGAAAPTGSAGFREAGAAKVFEMVGIEGTSGATIIVLMVSAADTALVLVAALVSAAYLRLDRMIALRKAV